MMKYLPIAALMLLMVSCGENNGGGQGTAVPASPANNAADVPQTQAPVQASNTGARLNPPHGEPGHRCEIGVGEPLPEDGSTPPPATPPQDIIQGQPLDVTTTMVDPGQAPDPNAVKLPSGTPNPPHGSPGHDCNVQVGEPLP